MQNPAFLDTSLVGSHVDFFAIDLGIVGEVIIPRSMWYALLGIKRACFHHIFDGILHVLPLPWFWKGSGWNTVLAEIMLLQIYDYLP